MLSPPACDQRMTRTWLLCDLQHSLTRLVGATSSRELPRRAPSQRSPRLLGCAQEGPLLVPHAAALHSFVNTDLGHWRKRGSLTGMSALPPKADIRPKVLISAFGLSSVQLHIERRYIRRALEMKQDDDFSHEIGDRHQHDQLSH